ncbi:beta-ketoacyl synthase N-terminal-like domain-containing protein [Vibrio jasicida]|uniref:beta-ketoacyl synthase N-terminal-like domain-containing protein n=1 Tax=Vibrio jasicida TaxID=766224 RepID=UPI0040680B92
MDRNISNDIAVISYACRFPQANSPEELWLRLQEGRPLTTILDESILQRSGVAPEIYKREDYVRVHGSIEGLDEFEPELFGIRPSDASLIDPQQRCFLTCAWEALERVGYLPKSQSLSIGVFGGVGTPLYRTLNLAHLDDPRIPFLNEKDFVTTRVSYHLNLTGPSVNVQTACSTSLVAVHMACQSILNGECDAALAGGCTIQLPHHAGYLYQPGGIHSPDGECRAFDQAAQGTVGGSGGGIVLLKGLEEALEDGDPILAVIKGSAVNNDGNLKVGFTAPSVQGQLDVIRSALEQAELQPSQIGYVESHGTGTVLGDPIEAMALKAVFSEAEMKAPLYIGTLKPVLGHTDTASGVAALIKAILVLNHKQWVPNLHIECPNPECGFDQSALSLFGHGAWVSEQRNAGISAFGIGGTNAHVIIQEPPACSSTEPERIRNQFFPIAARSPEQLARRISVLRSWLKATPDISLSTLSHQLAERCEDGLYRKCYQASSQGELLESLMASHLLEKSTGRETSEPVVFMFPGQGAQFAAMANRWLSMPEYARTLKQCFDMLLQQHQLDFFPFITDEVAVECISDTARLQPYLFSIEYALAKELINLGMEPRALIGHSLGEYVAACLAGVFSLEQALILMVRRGQLMQEAPSGQMIAVSMDAAAFASYQVPGISVAAINSPHQIVLSGAVDNIENLMVALKRDGIPVQRLPTSGAFHSSLMTNAAKQLRQFMSDWVMRPPSVPIISNVTGNWLKDEEATSADYWSEHVLASVKFGDGIMALNSELPSATYVEVGPQEVLSRFTKATIGSCTDTLSCLPKQRDGELKATLALFWQAGLIGSEHFRDVEGKSPRLLLPASPLSKEKYWVEPAHSRAVELSEPFWPVLTRRLDSYCTVFSSEFQVLASRYHEWNQMLQALCTQGFAQHSLPTELRTEFQLYADYWQSQLVGGNRTESFSALYHSASQNWPEEREVLQLIKAIADALPDIFIGRYDPREAIYSPTLSVNPQSLRERLQSFFNGLIQTAVAELSSHREHLELLEIGAGQGLTTQALLPIFEPHRTHYVFTDISMYFTNAAKSKFADYAFLDFQTFDVNKDPELQGFQAGTYQLVVATLSVHVAQSIPKTLRRIRELLAPNGLFIMWEITHVDPAFSFVESLVMPELDEPGRTSINPFYTRRDWQSSLSQSGFNEVKSYELIPGAGHCVFLAQANEQEYQYEAQRESVEAEPTCMTSTNLASEVEKKLAQMWTTLLGAEGIDRDSHFSELGGDSMVALMLVADIKEQMDVVLSNTVVMESPTIRQLAEVIEQTKARSMVSQARHLVPLCIDNENVPIVYCMHAISGSVYPYMPLAERLGKYKNVYGLQGISDEKFDSIEEMSLAYFSEIKTVNVDKPLVLIGHSFGGLVALEVARLCERNQTAVEAVIMLDTPAPGLDDSPVKSGHEWDILAFLLKVNYGLALGEPPHGEMTKEKMIQHAISRLTESGAKGSEKAWRYEMEQFISNSQLMFEYKPCDVPFRIHYIKAQERDPYLPHNPERYWQQVFSYFTGTSTPGDHNTLLGERYVSVLESMINEI